MQILNKDQITKGGDMQESRFVAICQGKRSLGALFRKNKKHPFFDMFIGSMHTKFQTSDAFRLVKRSGPRTQTDQEQI